MAKKNRSTLKSEKDIRFAANNSQEIGSEDHRDTFEDNYDSAVLWEDDVDTDTTLAANSDTKVPSQKAVKAYADSLVSSPGVPTADTPWGGYKITNLGDGTLSTDAVNKGQMDTADSLLQDQIDELFGGTALVLSISAGSVTWDADPAVNPGKIAVLSLTSNVTTFTINNHSEDTEKILILKQDATGGRTFATPTGYLVNGTGLDINDTGNSITVIHLYNGGTGYKVANTRNTSTGGGSGSGVTDNYASWAALLLDQGSQTSGGIYRVTDASGHSDISTGTAYFEYLGTAVGDETDYYVIGAFDDLDSRIDAIVADYLQAADIANFETTTELNARDTANRSRTNHTGTQAISTVTGLQTELDSKLESADIADFETSTELDDRDTANRNRANHTGTQAISTVTGLQTALDGKASTATTDSLQSQIDSNDTDIATNASGISTNAVDIAAIESGLDDRPYTLAWTPSGTIDFSEAQNRTVTLVADQAVNTISNASERYNFVNFVVNSTGFELTFVGGGIFDTVGEPDTSGPYAVLLYYTGSGYIVDYSYKPQPTFTETDTLQSVFDRGDTIDLSSGPNDTLSVFNASTDGFFVDPTKVQIYYGNLFIDLRDGSIALGTGTAGIGIDDTTVSINGVSNGGTIQTQGNDIFMLSGGDGGPAFLASDDRHPVTKAYFDANLPSGVGTPGTFTTQIDLDNALGRSKDNADSPDTSMPDVNKDTLTNLGFAVGHIQLSGAGVPTINFVGTAPDPDIKLLGDVPSPSAPTNYQYTMGYVGTDIFVSYVPYTNYGSVGGGVVSDIIARYDATGTPLSGTQQSAWNTFYTTIGDTRWNHLNYLLISAMGGEGFKEEAHALVDATGNFTTSKFGSPTFSTTTGWGSFNTDTCLDAGFSTSEITDNTDYCFGVLASNATDAVFQSMFGVYENGNNAFLRFDNANAVRGHWAENNIITFGTQTPIATEKVYTIARPSSLVISAYSDATLIGSTASDVDERTSTDNLYIGARNESGSGAEYWRGNVHAAYGGSSALAGDLVFINALKQLFTDLG